MTNIAKANQPISQLIVKMGIACALLLCIAYPQSHAQGDAKPLNIPVTGMKLPLGMVEALTRRVHVMPRDTVLSTSDTTVTLTLFNSYTDTLEASLKFYSQSPVESVIDPPNVRDSAKGDSTVGKAPKKRSLIDMEDTAGHYKDLTPWIREFPRKVQIGPRDSMQIEVKVSVPADATAGEYAGWLITEVIIAAPNNEVTTKKESEGNRLLSDGQDKGLPEGTRIVTAGKMVYRIR